MCYTRGIVSNVDVNKDLILENNLFIYNKALKFKCLLNNLKCFAKYSENFNVITVLQFTNELIKVK